MGNYCEAPNENIDSSKLSLGGSNNAHNSKRKENRGDKKSEKCALDVEHLLEDVSLDVISYSILPFLWFSNDLLADRTNRFLDYFGRYDCDPNRKIYQIFFYFHVKIPSEFEIFPVRDSLGMKFWNVFDRVPKSYLRKMRRIELLQSSLKHSDLVLENEHIDEVSSTIRDLKFQSKDLKIFTSISTCGRLRHLDLVIESKFPHLSNYLEETKLECRNLQKLKIRTSKERFNEPVRRFVCFPLENLPNLRVLDLGHVVIKNPKTFESLKGFKFLRIFSLYLCRMDSNCDIFQIFRSPSIEVVHMDDCTFNLAFSKNFRSEIPEGSRLTSISFPVISTGDSQTGNFDVSFLHEISKKCKKLKKISIPSYRIGEGTYGGMEFVGYWCGKDVCWRIRDFLNSRNLIGGKNDENKE